MRIFVGGILTETNTFSPVPTGLADFRVARADSTSTDLPNECLILKHLKSRIEASGWHCLPAFMAVAEPGGVTTQKAYESLRDDLLSELANAMPVDMVLLPLHGAMVAEGYDDCEADIATRVREVVGPEVAIGILLDLHCHLSQQLVEMADLIAIYREYPHTDILQRSEALLKMTADKQLGRSNPVMAVYDCRIVNLYPTAHEPMRSLVDHLDELDRQPGIISADIAHGFPWGDVADCGTRTLVISDGDEALAQSSAKALGRRLYDRRHELLMKPLAMEAALVEGMSNPDSRPVVIADIADNAGGGAPSDSTFALQALLELNASDTAFGMIYDPQVVDIAIKAGIGAEIRVRLGGKTSPASGQPLDLTVKVTGICRKMQQYFPQDGCEPIPVPCGDSVCLLCNGVYVIVNSIRTQVFHPEVFTQLGLQPDSLKVLVVKSIFHFYAAFAPLATKVLLMSTPGALNARFTEIPYKKVCTDQYPWLDDPLATELT